ncbi:Hypothetical predicted protein [Lecanosticta acicola]|uniref:Uncharacterized protein n=1 Tax=Lecanosticta acicola TaxID=111012 RepID=A0AAI8YZG2_9PEZI|nr:Hypothetical predicted protein [Lecanosticta acicola]
MGVCPSKTELILPSDSLRVCHPGPSCFCGQSHRSSRYVYKEVGGSFRDPVDLMDDFMYGGGGPSPSGLPGAVGMWKDAREWTVRDYERLGEIMNEWQMRERGRRSGGGGGGGGWGYEGDRRGGRLRRGDLERFQESVEEKFRRMAEEYKGHLEERDAFLFGTEGERRREMYKDRMLKTLREVLPGLMQGPGPGPQPNAPWPGGPGGMGWPPNGMGMGAGGINMPAPPQAGAFGMPPQMGAALPAPMPAMNPMMNGMPGMNPMAGVGAMNANMNMFHPAMAYPPGMMPEEYQPRRPGRGRGRRIALDDGFDDEPMFGGGRRFPYGGRRRRWDDEDDMLGGLGNGGPHSPRPPPGPLGGGPGPGPGRRPRPHPHPHPPPPSDFGPAGGLDADHAFAGHDMPPHPTADHYMYRPPPDVTGLYADPRFTAVPGRMPSPLGMTPGRPPSPRPDTSGNGNGHGFMRPEAPLGAPLHADLGAAFPGASSMNPPFPTTAFPPAPPGVAGPSTTRPPMPSRNVTFAPNLGGGGGGGGGGYEKLTASRSVEELRHEPEAGQRPSKKDLLGGDL